jgi:hypothetical protein
MFLAASLQHSEAQKFLRHNPGKHFQGDGRLNVGLFGYWCLLGESTNILTTAGTRHTQDFRSLSELLN